MRDHIHLQDLAHGHGAAVRTLLDGASSFTVNLGAGHGHSVLEAVRALETASGQPVPFQIAPGRPGAGSRQVRKVFKQQKNKTQQLNPRPKSHAKFNRDKSNIATKVIAADA